MVAGKDGLEELCTVHLVNVCYRELIMEAMGGSTELDS